MKSLLKNWRSSLSGIGTILGGASAIALAVHDGFQTGDTEVILAGWAAITGGFGLLFTRDATVSTEESRGE